MTRPEHVTAPPERLGETAAGSSSEREAAAQLLAEQRAGGLARLSRLEQEFAGIVESGSGGADDEHDPEGATLAFERQHLGALISDVRRHLAEIDAAVCRLDDGG
jgi:DnaK suppressor protein